MGHPLKSDSALSVAVRRRCIIHVGGPNTDAAFIQHAMTIITSAAGTADICYPTCGRARGDGHDNAAHELRSDSDFDPSLGTLDDLESELANSNASQACLSSDLFSSLVNNRAAVETLIACISRAGFEPHFVLYARSQLDAAEELYSRMVIDLAYANRFRRGTPPNVGDFLRGIALSGNYDGTAYCMRYDAVAATLSTYVGREAVTVRPYSHGTPMLRDFLALFGVRSADALAAVHSLLPGRRVPYNDAFHALRVVANGAQLQESLEIAGQCSFEPATNDELQLFEQRFAESNDALATQFGVSIPTVSGARRALADRVAKSADPEARALRYLQEFVHGLDLSRARAFSNLMTSYSKTGRLSSTQPKICYVHIGTHKTGTTAIQYFLTENEDALLKCGLYYPFQGRRGINHANIAWELYAPSLSLPERGTLKDLGDELHAANAPICCISAEDFEYIGSEPDSIQRLVDTIKGAGYDVRIILFVRPQVDYMEADYAQLAVNAMFYGDTNAEPAASLNAYLDEAIGTGAFQQIGRTLFEYDVLADAFASVVGLNNVIVRSYRAGASVIPDFLNIIFDADKTPLPALRSVPRAENTRASFGDVLHCQRVDASSHPVLADAVAVAGHHPFRPFTREIMQRIGERFEAANVRLLHRYAVALPTVSSRRLSFADWVEAGSDSAAAATTHIQSFFADYAGSAATGATPNRG